jgi:hypothetical protein
MSPSLDGQCPSCHKRFENDSSVLRHMNSRRTSCTTWFDFLESMSPPTQLPISHPTQHTSSQNRPNGNATHNDDGEAMLVDEAISNPIPPHYEDIHQNTPLIFGSGAGFTDVFNSDHHAEKRRGNLYHPFSSKEEWGLGSWLSRSGLSMRAIDDFLALPMVRSGRGYI